MTDSEFDKFKEIVAGLEPQPLDSIVMALLDYFTGLIDAAQYIDMENEVAVNDFCRKLTYQINDYFEALDGLDFDDQVALGSQGAVILSAREPYCATIYRVARGAQLQGTLAGLVVSEIPEESSVVLAEERTAFEEAQSLPVICFGLSFIFEDPVLAGDNGMIAPIPAHFEVCVPLNYPDQPLQKVL